VEIARHPADVVARVGAAIEAQKRMRLRKS
jgi:hypothetical protein